MLNYESFAVRIREDEIPNLIEILRVLSLGVSYKLEHKKLEVFFLPDCLGGLYTLQGIKETEIEFKLANVQKIWQRFLYRNSILLEAERQKTAFGLVEDWAIQFLQQSEDDVFTTFVQVFFFCTE